MSTIKVINAIHPSGSTTNIVNDNAGNVTIGNNLTVTGNETVGGNLTVTGGLVPSSSFKRNRIINGNMLIDQRNAGASVTPSGGTYTLDRWFGNASVPSKFSVQQNAGSVTPPSGFTYYLGITSLSAYSVAAGDFFAISQAIEGYNVADLGWGAAGASSITISFWVRSSLTGTFGGGVNNSTGTRSYPFTYTISAANTWEQKSVTISGDTSGTWQKTNGVGIQLNFGLGVGSTYSGTAGAWAATNYVSATGAVSVVGTSGATFYVTGVQLEVGTKATPYEMQIYSDQLAQCCRYFQWVPFSFAFTSFSVGQGFGATVPFQVQMRVRPSFAAITADPASFQAVTSAASCAFTGSLSTVNAGYAGGASSAVGTYQVIGYRSAADAEL